MKRHHLRALILSAQLATSSFAQQPATSPAAKPTPSNQTTPPQPQKPEDVEVVRITTNLVQVDAVVTDKNGKVVTDFKPDEVKIMEDGRPQKITNFSYYVTETPAAPALIEKPATVDKNAAPVPPTRLKPEDIRRTIAIVVDDLGLSFESTYYVRRALKRFVDEQMQPGDLVAIIRTGGGMGALQQFTADKRQLYAAIERVKWNALGRGGVSAFAALQPPTPGAGGAEIDALTEEQTQARDEIFSVGTLGAISYVVRGLKELPGRKSILLVSDGFKISGLEDPTQTNQSLLPRAPRNNLASNKLSRLIEEANRASVVIYTLNATGLQTLGLTAADDAGGRSSDEVQQQLGKRRTAAYENQEGLDVLARETGGIAIRNTNDLSRGIRRVLEDQKGFYLIGYRPDSSTFDPRTGRRTFHKLSLKVLRPGKFNVRMRNGFFGVSDEDRRPPERTLAQKLVGALTSPFGATGVHLQLTSLFANDAKLGSFMRSVLHIDGRDLTFTDEPDKMHRCVFDVLAMTFGDNGSLVDQPTGRTYTLQFPDEVYKRVLRDGLVYYVTVPIKKPGAYQLRMSLRDSPTERIGSANQFIEVPDLKKDRLAISGIVLRGTNASSRNAGTSANANPGENQEGVEQGNAEASPAVRHFARGMFMDYIFVIYNAHVDKSNTQPRVTTQVRLFRGSALVFNGKENPYKGASQTDFKRLIAGGEIQLGTDLVPGEYTLQIVVNDLLADQKHRTVTQWMDFEIVK